MIVLLLFAFLSGIATILSPCILPVLPIVLSGSGGGRKRPLGIIIGFVGSFTIFTLSLSFLIQLLNIPGDSLRFGAVIIIILFGLVLTIPWLQHRFELIAAKLARKGNSGKKGTGFTGGILLGTGLGLVWTPCVGPIMASVITLAVTSSVDKGAFFITLAYSIGTAIPMFAIMMGGRKLLNHFPFLSGNRLKVQKVFGILMILVGISIAFGFDRKFQSLVLDIFPSYGSSVTVLENSDIVRTALDQRSAREPLIMMSGSAPPMFNEVPENGKLGDYGLAPSIVTNGEWLNTDGEALSLNKLRGKVVLIDFWTYSCVNCVRTIPHLRDLYNNYKDDGFEIIGVHTPEFPFERNLQNVQKAADQLQVTWPVVQDNKYAQWRAYNNRYWPAHYFIDTSGSLRYFQFGEGHYYIAEKVVRTLLKEGGNLVSEKMEGGVAHKNESRTAETYLGYKRTTGFASGSTLIEDQKVKYSSGQIPGNGEWTLDGFWTFKSDHIESENSGILELGFYAKNVYLVIEPIGETGWIEVLIDGVKAGDNPDLEDGILKPVESRLYQLINLNKAGSHILNIKVHGKLKLFAFTFG